MTKGEKVVNRQRGRNLLIDINVQNLQREYAYKKNYLNSFEKGGEVCKKEKNFIKREKPFIKGEKNF